MAKSKLIQRDFRISTNSLAHKDLRRLIGCLADLMDEMIVLMQEIHIVVGHNNGKQYRHE